MHDIAAVPGEGAHDAAGVEGEADELTLIRAAQEYPPAFGPLYLRYRDRVHAYLHARVTTPEDAADLTQQVFLQALDALPRYCARGAPFAAWLFRIARNAAANQRRRHRETIPWEVAPEVLRPLVGEDSDAPVAWGATVGRDLVPGVGRADEGNPAADVLRRDDLAHLMALVNALEPAKRELLILRFVAGLSTPEIARVVGKGEAATKKQLWRTLQTLKEQYHD